MARLCHELLSGMVFLLLPAVGAAAATVPVFEKDVLPVFQAHCLRCHGEKKLSADLDLRRRGTLLKGGEAGPAVAVGAPERSLLWIKIAGDKMPPGKDKLSAAEKALVRAWIEAGAPALDASVPAAIERTDRQVSDGDRQFWSFQPPRRPLVPAVRNIERCRNPIDCFIIAALERRGLGLSPEADRLTLLRRVTFDLTGLPPLPEQVAGFLRDTRPDAYERLVDGLLASPAYGERWGRHWLDLAGYADSEGILDADYVRTAAWRYRDYVIRSINRDKPYDRFLQEQIAGDELTGYWEAHASCRELPEEVVEGLVATGYLRCASDTSRPDFANIKNAPGYYFQTLDDTLKIVASSTMGLTLQCARCHSHKYDPIAQTDYYRVQAIFMSAYRPYQWIPQAERRLFQATAAQEKSAKEHNARVDATVAGLKKQADDLRQEFATRYFDDRLATLPASIRDDVRGAIATRFDRRTEVQKYLFDKFGALLKPAAKDLPGLLARYPDFAARDQALARAIQVAEASRQTFAELRALYDLPGEARTHLLRRGDYLNPGPKVEPGTVSVLGQMGALAPRPSGSKTSGARLAFARWLTQPDHPLTARVAVNRLWLGHFGEGLVSTPDNFGRSGAVPSHPELLDWLATELPARGWSLKALHRLMVTSCTYRQDSTVLPAQAAARRLDPENRLCWRQRLRRLEAEPLRDAVLSVAGGLNRQMLGTPVPVDRRPDGEVVTADDAAGRRRSVYVLVRRSQPVTMLQVFDQPRIETNCTRRDTSTVPLQALTLLNSDFMLRQADAFAARVLHDHPDDPAGAAVLIALSRPARDEEKQGLRQFLEGQAARHAADGANRTEASRRALTDVCHALLAANEFAYVD